MTLRRTLLCSLSPEELEAFLAKHTRSALGWRPLYIPSTKEVLAEWEGTVRRSHFVLRRVGINTQFRPGLRGSVVETPAGCMVHLSFFPPTWLGIAGALLLSALAFGRYQAGVRDFGIFALGVGGWVWGAYSYLERRRAVQTFEAVLRPFLLERDVL